MVRITHLNSLLTASVSLLAFTTSAVQAQQPVQLAMANSIAADNADSSSDVAAAADAEGLTDIVVTAERREVSLQQTPLSVSALTADMLKAANITDITGLNGTVPGLVIAKSGGGERMISIRGIGSETPENTNTQPGVSYHIDGVYIFNSIAASAAFIDVAQVEVLRGPQGTLFGQGSTGGTINIVSIEPSAKDLSGTASLGVGNYHYVESNAALNVPIGDRLSIRGAIQHVKHDGYSNATDVPGYRLYELDDANDTSWRIGAKWSPLDNLSITLNTIQYYGTNNGPAQKNILDPQPDARLLTQDYAGRSLVHTQLYSGVIRWDTDFATIKSISSYQKLHSEQSWDGDGLNTTLFFPVSGNTSRYDHVALWQQDTESYTSELNLATHMNGPLNFVLGGVYLWSKNNQYINEYRANNLLIQRPALSQDTSSTDPRVQDLTYAELSSITREQYAFFGQATYDITSQLKLTGGIRYNHDKSTGLSDSGPKRGAAVYPTGAYLQPRASAPRSADEITGKAAVEYQFTPTNMIYASYTRGFKPGGINSAASAGSSAYALGFRDNIKPTYESETVDSFEIGSKNRFVGNSIQINASGFLYNYKNMQFLEEDPVLFGEGIANAPKARVYGAELEGSWLPVKGLRFDGSMSWLEGKFTADYLALDPTNAQNAQNAAGYAGTGGFFANYFPATLARYAARANINGNRVPKLPRWQGNISATYTGEIGPGLLTSRAQFIYRGDYQYRLFNEGAVDTTPSYTQVNLMFKYEPLESGADITLRVTNLFDTNGINSRFSDPYGSSQVMDTYIPPRQIILSVGYKF
ncbi:TonB-dependent receptor [Sphingobium sufflavum]|uniref:TonB-dependent receptor n=1 Tax=Sphingobium sufflavum TaxID=1129547 RepID=UPI001F365A1B|nr:TonB-dependent receptor [Sphingobium sufflavum]MCE7798004.1 TonB-dependent receptor [Sphingobium sufflavum]